MSPAAGGRQLAAAACVGDGVGGAENGGGQGDGRCGAHGRAGGSTIRRWRWLWSGSGAARIRGGGSGATCVKSWRPSYGRAG
eukprot:1229576-Prymnesium_polylepis.1